MKINNWLEAQEILERGSRILSSILAEYVEENGRMLMMDEINRLVITKKGRDDTRIEDYVVSTKNKLFGDVTKDMEEANQFLDNYDSSR